MSIFVIRYLTILIFFVCAFQESCLQNNVEISKQISENKKVYFARLLFSMEFVQWEILRFERDIFATMSKDIFLLERICSVEGIFKVFGIFL